MIPHFHEDRLGVILKELEPFKKEIQGIVVESTYNWYWLVDGLQKVKYKVHLANPAEMQQYSGMKYTDDKWDSYWLAHMLRLSILPEGYIYPKEIRPVRDLLRKRTMLVRHRLVLVETGNGACIKSAKHDESQYGEKIESQRCEEAKRRKKSDQLADEHHKTAVQSDKAVVDFFNERIDRIENAVSKEVKLRYPYEELLTAPGIGKILGVTIMLETGDVNRFSTVSGYSSYCKGIIEWDSAPVVGLVINP